MRRRRVGLERLEPLEDDEGPPSSSLSRIMISSDGALEEGPAWAPPLVCERLPPFEEADDARNPMYARPSSASLSATLLGDP